MLAARAATIGLLVAGLPACGCLPHGTSLRVTLTDRSGSPVPDAVVTCALSGSPTETARQVASGVYECGTGQGIFFLDIQWHGTLIVSERIDIFEDSANCASISTPIGISLVLPPTAIDGGASSDAGVDAASLLDARTD
jgi:hypothetical protein